MLVITSLFLLISNAVTTRRDKSILYSRISKIILMSCFILGLNSLDIKFLEKGLGLFSGFLQNTALSHIFHLFIFIIVFFILGLNSFYPRKVWSENYDSFLKKTFFKLIYKANLITNKMSESYTIIEYPLIILFITIGGVLLISSSDLITIFIAIELQSYGLYILCVTYRDSESATSAGLTYFLLGGLSSCFILLGFALIYANSGNTTFDGLYIINNITSIGKETGLVESKYNNDYFNFSLLIMSVGFLFKIGAAPFHFWSPDVYDAIPTNVTTFVASFAKISILILLLELIHYTSNSLELSNEIFSLKINSLIGGEKIELSWTFSLLISSLLSLIIGSVLGLTQYRIKRLYAYSTISHLGFMLLALAVNTIESTQSFIFYLIQYSITNLNAFILIIAIGYSLYIYEEKKKEDETKGKRFNREFLDKENSPIQFISQIKGYFYINPFISLSLAITLFSFVGIPPLIGFFAKQMILSSALDKGYVFMVFIGILTSVVSAYYYLVLVKEMFFNKSNYEINPTLNNISLKGILVSRFSNINENKKNLTKSLTNDIIITKENIVLSSHISIVISILTLITLFFIFIPQEWLNLATILALIMFNN